MLSKAVKNIKHDTTTLNETQTTLSLSLYLT